jgi:uncharacterized protein (DUF885 family)
VLQLFNDHDNIDLFFDQVFIDSFDKKPQALNQIQMSHVDKTADQRLNDYTIEGKKENLDHAKSNLKTLLEFDYESLTSVQKITYKILQWQYEHEIAGEKFMYNEYVISHSHGVFKDLVDTFTRFHKIETVYDFENYKTRLEEIPKQIAQVKAFLIEQFKMGIKLPEFTLKKLIYFLSEYYTSTGKQHPFYIYCEKRIDVLPLFEKQSLDWLEHIINSQVIPAFEDLKECMVQLQLFTDTNHGLCALPNGKEYYDYCLQRHTTTNLSAQEIHDLGIKEVEKIEMEIRGVLESVGIKDPSQSLGILLSFFEKKKRPFLQKVVVKDVDIIQSFRKILDKSRFLNKLQMSRKKVPLLRKKGDFKAYTEGWELFSQKISDERGMNKNICDKLDYLQLELLGAVKLVLDSGIHAMGWSFEDAFDYMITTTGFKRQSVISEIENCFVNPGEACACKIGQLKFLEWRQMAMDALGDQFSLSGYCNAIQNIGGAPLVVLGEVLNTRD